MNLCRIPDRVRFFQTPRVLPVRFGSSRGMIPHDRNASQENARVARSAWIGSLSPVCDSSWGWRGGAAFSLQGGSR